jgi:hypothetical protein
MSFNEGYLNARFQYTWNSTPHPDSKTIIANLTRIGQVWEDVDGWVFYVIGPPSVAAYEHDGRPFQLNHPVFVISSDGCMIDWALFETVDRPLELKHKRLA